MEVDVDVGERAGDATLVTLQQPELEELDNVLVDPLDVATHEACGLPHRRHAAALHGQHPFPGRAMPMPPGR